MSLIEMANALTTAQKEMILKRVRCAEVGSGSAVLNSLTRCYRFSAAARALNGTLQTVDDRNWGTWVAYICSRSFSGGVETTPEGQSLDWDGALDVALTAKDISVKKTANG